MTPARLATDDEAACRAHCRGVARLDARLEPWQVALCRAPESLDELIERYGSPVNIHHPGPFARNVAALQAMAISQRIDVEVLFARKADKALVYVDRARALGIGVDTASEQELTEVLEQGVDPALVVTTAAVKTERLLRAAIAAGVTIVLDNLDELDRVVDLAAAAGRVTPVALRFGGFQHAGARLPTRFGFDIDEVPAVGAELAVGTAARILRLEGVHFHLDGYAVDHRIAAVRQLLPVVDLLRALGHPIRHLDIGGGLPMRYVDDPDQWAWFEQHLREALLGDRPPITYRNAGLGLRAHDGHVVGELAVYPAYQPVVGADWLAMLLDDEVAHVSLAEELRRRALTLRCEPGRSLLDGCGLTVARVEHRKLHRDGSWSVGVAMHRSQAATGKVDHAVDPLLIPRAATVAGRSVHGLSPSSRSAADRQAPMEGFLVGAVCTESDLLTARRLRFPSGVARGDLIVFVNTAGYLMHFVETRTHRFPLATNLVCSEVDGAMTLDLVDRVPPS